MLRAILSMVWPWHTSDRIQEGWPPVLSHFPCLLFTLSSNPLHLPPAPPQLRRWNIGEICQYKVNMYWHIYFKVVFLSCFLWAIVPHPSFSIPPPPSFCTRAHTYRHTLTHFPHNLKWPSSFLNLPPGWLWSNSLSCTNFTFLHCIL